MAQKKISGGPGQSASTPSREELIYLLSRACELEHGLACVYLFAAHSLKSDPREGGITAEEAAMTRSWKRKLSKVAVEEMLHLAQVTNLLTAIGGAPHFRRANFPLPSTAFAIGIELSLEPFSHTLAERLVAYEMPEEGILTPEQDVFYSALRQRAMGKNKPSKASASGATMQGYEPFEVDFSTVGELYHKVENIIRAMPEEELFIGPREAQANGRFLDFGGQLVEVVDRASACAAIDMIIEQGEAPSSVNPEAHFWVFDSVRIEYEAAVERAKTERRDFDPVRKVVANPMTRFYDDTSGGTVIVDPRTHLVAEIYNVAYDTMLLMLLRFFAHSDEDEAELEHLARASLRAMTTVLRPLGEALTKMPVGGEGAHGRTAGPGFGFNRDVHLLPHKRSAWIFFGERLRELAIGATRLRVEAGAQLPAEVEEATAALEALAEEFAPKDRKWNANAEEAEFRVLEGNGAPKIIPEKNGPFLVTNLENFVNSRGEKLKTQPEMALCRCGRSRSKPYCDGSHPSVGFADDKNSDRTPDGVLDYVGPEITVHYNRLVCAASEHCWKSLPEAFRTGEEPWIRPELAETQRVIEVVRRCPSGALRYTYRGHLGPRHRHRPQVRIIENGPYEVRGVALEGAERNEGASPVHYTLCRCGASKNKPFCDGSHWAAKFVDKKN